MKEIKQDLNKCINISCTWVRRLSIIKMSILSNLAYRFNAIPINIPVNYFMDMNKLILELTDSRIG